MSIVLHAGRWQLWVGYAKGRIHFGRLHSLDHEFGLTIEVY